MTTSARTRRDGDLDNERRRLPRSFGRGQLFRIGLAYLRRCGYLTAGTRIDGHAGHGGGDMER
jgi:hypothetical protein